MTRETINGGGEGEKGIWRGRRPGKRKKNRSTGKGKGEFGGWGWGEGHLMLMSLFAI